MTRVYLPSRMIRDVILGLMVTAFSLVAVPTCYADIIVGDPPTLSMNIRIFAPTGQSFVADYAALKSIGMWTATCNCPNDPPMTFQLSLLAGAGTSGAPVATRTATAPIGLYGFLDFDFRGVQLNVGQTYTAVMSPVSPDPPSSAGTAIYGVQNAYSGGVAFVQGQANPNIDFSLRVLDDHPPAFKLLCQGGPAMTIVTNHDVPAPGHIGAIAMFIYFKAGATPAHPGPGECVWVDRTFRPGEPEVMWIKSPNIAFAFEITGDGRLVRDASGVRLNVEDNTPEAQDWDYLVKGVLEARDFAAEVFNADGRVMQITHVDR